MNAGSKDLFSLRDLRRRAQAVPALDRHDYVHAIRSMQEALSPELVLALVDAVEAAQAVDDNTLVCPAGYLDALGLALSKFEEAE